MSTLEKIIFHYRLTKDENGNYILDDMILTEEQYDQSYGSGKEDPGLSGIRDKRYRWKGGEGVKAGVYVTNNF